MAVPGRYSFVVERRMEGGAGTMTDVANRASARLSATWTALASVRLHDCLGDGQAEPQAAKAMLPGSVPLFERIENMWQGFGANPNAVIFDADTEAV